ncbi:hypothetical protein PMAYCL1PPCAC_01781, partial [Pristionchus mayeri]
TPRGQKTDASTTGPNSEPCPDDFFEGNHGCLMLLNIRGKYTNSLSLCQDLPNGDMISYYDLSAEFAGISKLMKYNGLPLYRWFVNGFMSPLSRTFLQAQVVWVSSSTPLLTSNDSIVSRSQVQESVGTICKVPKYGLRWACPTAPALLDAPHIEFADPNPPAFLNYTDKIYFQCKDKTVHERKYTATCTERGVVAPAASIFNPSCAPEEKPAPPPMEKEVPMPGLRCTWCEKRGTHHCEKGEKGEDDRCICNEGWRGKICNRHPRFCPRMSCPKDSHCEERVDHAVCVCET